MNIMKLKIRATKVLVSNFKQKIQPEKNVKIQN